MAEERREIMLKVVPAIHERAEFLLLVQDHLPCMMLLQLRSMPVQALWFHFDRQRQKTGEHEPVVQGYD